MIPMFTTPTHSISECIKCIGNIFDIEKKVFKYDFNLKKNHDSDSFRTIQNTAKKLQFII